jgi:mono/diheme cytochrome c family protein
MNRLFKWLGLAIASLLGLGLVAAAVVWTVGGRAANTTYDIPKSSFVSNPETANIEEGRRLATTRGCFHGCHGGDLEGEVFVDEFIFGHFNAPDLTRAFAERSDVELEGIIRHGVFEDGRSTLMMPSAGFHHLSDDDLNDIFAFIRSQPRSDGVHPLVQPGLVARYMIWTDYLEPQAKQIKESAPFLVPEQEHAYGKYVALTVCAECHSTDLLGFADFSPSLVAVAAYSPEDFHRLMTEGIPVGDRELDLMASMSKNRFVHLTEEEEAALYNFLRTLAN